jgi:hypothetical protein
MNKEKLKENCCTPEGQIKRYIDCKGCDREPKQETVEEIETIGDFIKKESKSGNESVGIVKGAKWQTERMYSEEEVIELLTARCKHFGTTMTPFRELLLKQDLEWFEENKKNSMGKVTIEFDTVEEAQDIRDALDGYKWKLAVWDLDQKLRETTKYGASLIGTKPGASAEEQDVAEKVRDLIREYLSDYNLEIE